MLVSLAAFLFILLIGYMTNPPYCWGDVLGPKEWAATREPQLGNVILPIMLGNTAIFAFLFGTGIAAKFIFGRYFKR